MAAASAALCAIGAVGAAPAVSDESSASLAAAGQFLLGQASARHGDQLTLDFTSYEVRVQLCLSDEEIQFSRSTLCFPCFLFLLRFVESFLLSFLSRFSLFLLVPFHKDHHL